MGTYQRSLFGDEEATKRQVKNLGREGVPYFQKKKEKEEKKKIYLR